MQTLTFDSKESVHKFFAYNDARISSIAQSTHYDNNQKIKADRMKFALELVYAAKDIYVTFRKKFIALKIDNARVIDKKNLAELEAQWAGQGIIKVVTPQGVTYRIPKA